MAALTDSMAMLMEVAGMMKGVDGDDILMVVVKITLMKMTILMGILVMVVELVGANGDDNGSWW